MHKDFLTDPIMSAVNLSFKLSFTFFFINKTLKKISFKLQFSTFSTPIKLHIVRRENVLKEAYAITFHSILMSCENFSGRNYILQITKGTCWYTDKFVLLFHTLSPHYVRGDNTTVEVFC